MDPSEDYAALIKLLKERGHTDEEIKLILAKVRQYDQRTLHDSVMDSIGAGRMNLDALIKEALED
jgi:hypothetical protein